MQTKAERCWQELRLTPPEGGTLHRWDFSRVYTSKVHHGLQKFQGVEEFLENLKSKFPPLRQVFEKQVFYWTLVPGLFEFA